VPGDFGPAAVLEREAEQVGGSPRPDDSPDRADDALWGAAVVAVRLAVETVSGPWFSVRDAGPADPPRRRPEAERWAAYDRAEDLLCRRLRDLFPDPSGPPFVAGHLLAWRDGLLGRLARAAHETLLPEGTLDPDHTSVLADALEDAGVGGEMVSHLREPGPHWRGCWVLDALTGRELTV
jgi:hypothetical protein